MARRHTRRSRKVRRTRKQQGRGASQSSASASASAAVPNIPRGNTKRVLVRSLVGNEVRQIEYNALTNKNIREQIMHALKQNQPNLPVRHSALLRHLTEEEEKKGIDPRDLSAVQNGNTITLMITEVPGNENQDQLQALVRPYATRLIAQGRPLFYPRRMGHYDALFDVDDMTVLCADMLRDIGFSEDAIADLPYGFLRTHTKHFYRGYTNSIIVALLAFIKNEPQEQWVPLTTRFILLTHEFMSHPDTYRILDSFVGESYETSTEQSLMNETIPVLQAQGDLPYNVMHNTISRLVAPSYVGSIPLAYKGQGFFWVGKSYAMGLILGAYAYYNIIKDSPTQYNRMHEYFLGLIRLQKHMATLAVYGHGGPENYDTSIF